MRKYTEGGSEVVMIGAGRLATHLSRALRGAGHRIVQVYSRHPETARTLAEESGAAWTNDKGGVEDGADVYIYAVSDDVLPTVIKGVHARSGVHVHTAGSVGIEIFAGRRERYGSVYPLQTFSKEKRVDFREIPVFYEGNSAETECVLRELCRTITPKVYSIDSEGRRRLHLAAVMACNFANMLWGIASEILQKSGVPFEVMRPLIAETLDKAMAIGPDAAQTGPAARGDLTVVERHIAMLEGQPEWQRIYKDITELIYHRHDGH